MCILDCSFRCWTRSCRQNPNSPVDAIVPSDFFIDALKSAKDDSNDPMGTQRLIQVKDSSITPVVTASSAFKYTSNPDKIKNPTRDDGTTLDLTLSLNVGLGEYGIGDDILAVPAFSFMQMRTFTDPIREYGDDMQAFDVDVQVIGFTLPFVLPDDFTLTIGHSYVAPSTFRGKNQLISYSNTPSVTFAKTFLWIGVMCYLFPLGRVIHFLKVIPFKSKSQTPHILIS